MGGNHKRKGTYLFLTNEFKGKVGRGDIPRGGGLFTTLSCGITMTQ